MAVSYLDIDFFEAELNVNGGKKAIRAILDSNVKYSAILCFSDVLALGAYFSLNEAGLRIPQDISVMGFDNLDWSGHAVPPLTSIDLPAEQMGKEVATQLMKSLEKNQAVKPTLLEAEIVVRGSVKRV